MKKLKPLTRSEKFSLTWLSLLLLLACLVGLYLGVNYTD
jgi:hypothetical protein